MEPRSTEIRRPLERAVGFTLEILACITAAIVLTGVTYTFTRPVLGWTGVSK